MDNKFYKTREDIAVWLKENQIKNYKLIADEEYGFVVTVFGDVILSNRKLEFIPVKFKFVSNSFSCAKNELTSLDFCPEKVGGDFYCNDNKLTSLKFCPEKVGGSFCCDYNELINLKFCPIKVNGSFYCHCNKEFGLLQSETDFKKIYQAHLDYGKFLEYEKLNALLKSDNIKKNKI